MTDDTRQTWVTPTEVGLSLFAEAKTEIQD